MWVKTSSGNLVNLIHAKAIEYAFESVVAVYNPNEYLFLFNGTREECEVYMEKLLKVLESNNLVINI